MHTREHAGVWSRAAQVYAVGLLLAYVLLLLFHAAPPSLTDYANWTYQGVLLHRHLLGLADPAHALKLYPVPNSAATVAIALLHCVLPWKLAAKLWLSLQLGLSFLAVRRLLRTLRAPTTHSAAWLIVPSAVFLNVNLWYGFMNFQLGLCWILFTASLLLRRLSPASPARDWPVGVILLLAFFTHMIPFAFCGLLVLLYARQTRRLRILGQLLPAAIATLWYLAGRFLLAGNADGQAGMEATVRTYSAAFWAYKGNSYLKSFGFINPGSLFGSEDITLFGRPLFLTLFLLNLVLACLLGWAMIQAARRSLLERAPERFLWQAILLMLPFYLLAPGTALGVSDPGSRLLQSALALGLVLCTVHPFARQTLLLRTAAVCAIPLALSGLFLFARLAFPPALPVSVGAPLPRPVVLFAHVPNDDQDFFYAALARNDLTLKVFPTGIFLNRK